MLRYDHFSTKAGFNLEYYNDEPTEISYKNKKEFFGFLYAITSQLSELPHEEEKKIFIQKIVEGYLDVVPELPDGSIKVDFYFAKLIARKVIE